MTETTRIEREARPQAAAPSLGPLLVVSGAQLLIVMNDVIANVGIPAIQTHFGMSPAVLPWVINAYILLFGALLLFGGRLGDLYGRRRMLRIGIVVFALGALGAGLAVSGPMLILARAVQGIGAALTAPNVLASITSTFPEGKPRNTALGLYAAMSGLGIAIGLLAGGSLTGTLGWQSMFFMNVPIAVLLLVGTRTLVEGEVHRGKLDVTGAILGTGAMASLVYAITRGGEYGWGDPLTLGFLVAAAAGISAFLLTQSKLRDPMLPLRVFRNRNRAGAYIGMLLVSFGPMGMFYLLNLYLQYVLAYSPLQTGLAWLPFAFGIVLGAGIGAKLVVRCAPRVIVASGMIITAMGLVALSRISTETSFWLHLMPAIFATAFGFALNFVPLTGAGVNSADQQDAGKASALLNAGQQLGTVLGVAVVSSIAVTVTQLELPDALSRLTSARASGDADVAQHAKNALIDGYSAGMLVGAIVLALAAVVTATIINAKRPVSQSRQPVA